MRFWKKKTTPFRSLKLLKVISPDLGGLLPEIARLRGRCLAKTSANTFDSRVNDCEEKNSFRILTVVERERRWALFRVGNKAVVGFLEGFSSGTLYKSPSDFLRLPLTSY